MGLTIDEIHRVIEHGRIVPAPVRTRGGELRLHPKRSKSVKVKTYTFHFGDAFVTYRNNPRLIIDVIVRYKSQYRVR